MSLMVNLMSEKKDPILKVILNIIGRISAWSWACIGGALWFSNDMGANVYVAVLFISLRLDMYENHYIKHWFNLRLELSKLRRKVNINDKMGG